MDNDDSTSSADLHSESCATKPCQPFRWNLDHFYYGQSLRTSLERKSDPAWPAARFGSGSVIDTSPDGLGLDLVSEEACSSTPSEYVDIPTLARHREYDIFVEAMNLVRLREGDSLRKHCQVEACTMPPSYGVDGSTPAILCDNRRAEDMQRVRQDDASCGHEGCEREAEARHMSLGDRVDRFCSERKQSGIAVIRAKQCEYPECHSTPRYGPQGAPPSYFQSHKRAGMYTISDDMIFMATRDDDAFRPTDIAAEDIGGKASGGAAKVSRTASKPGRSSAPRGRLQTPRVVPGWITRNGRNTRSTRLRFCSGHKQEDMVTLRNCSCVYPGCTARPHYGLPRGQALYCSKHKHDGMVHLLREALTSGKEENSRKREESLPSWKKGRLLMTQPKVERFKSKRAKDVRAEDQHVGRVDAADDTREGGVDEGEAGSVNASKRKMVAAGRTTKKWVKRTDPVGSPAPSTLASQSALEAVVLQLPQNDAPGPTIPAETSLDVTAASTAPSPVAAKRSDRHSRLAGPSGMTPSVEMKLIHEARESARVEAEASGSGRRARAPSRKALEASGKLGDEGVQWLTREKKKEQASLKKELKEQRKAAAAAGLKAGQVIEALVVPIAVGGAAVGGVGDGEAMPLKINWRKLTPAEILQAAGQQLVQDGTVDQPHGGRTAATAENEVVAFMQDANAASIAGAQDSEECVTGTLKANTAVGADSVTSGNKSTRKSTFIVRPRDEKQDGSAANTVKADHASADGDIQKRFSDEEEGAKGRTTEGEETGTVQVVCVFPRCAKNATFGVNGNARYCEMHRLFGMRKMSGKT